MAVFYNREKSKIGTLTGSIIHWSKQLTTNDPDDTNTKDLLPAGYLRCDGSIYAAEIFPALAEILGVGSQSRYKKPNITLLENQFQLPDFGSKKLRASSGANLGDEVNLRILDDNDNEITKSGVGLSVESNIGTQYEILYQGNFFLPAQQIPVTGEPKFVRSFGNYTEYTEVLENAFMPHAHFHDGNRTRVRSSTGTEFGPIGRHFYTHKSTICVVPWYYNTYQELCLMAATREELSDESTPDGFSEFFGFSCSRTIHGGCLTGCNFLAAFECLIPDLDAINPDSSTFVKQEFINNYGECVYPLWSGQSNCTGGNKGSLQEETCGNIDYQGTVFSYCEGNGCNGVFGLGAMPARGSNGSFEPSIALTPNYTDLNLPFDSFKQGDDPDTYSGISNTTVETEPFGDTANHRHFLNFTAQPQTFVVNTLPTFIPSAALLSTINIQVNQENKADQFIQPYLVQEFLIKY